jgi:hypothetical protein
VAPTGGAAVGVAVLALGFVAATAVSVVSGVFGREFALIGVGWCGAWTALTANVVVRAVTDDADLLAGFVAVLGLSVGGFFVSLFGWLIGTAACGLSGHFTSRELSEVAYARTGKAGSASGRHFDEILDEVGHRHGSNEQVIARSMGVERRTAWSRPVAVVATDRRLIVAPLNADYEVDSRRLDRPDVRAGIGVGRQPRPRREYPSGAVESRRHHRHHHHRRRPPPIHPRLRVEAPVGFERCGGRRCRCHPSLDPNTCKHLPLITRSTTNHGYLGKQAGRSTSQAAGDRRGGHPTR